MEYCFNIWEFRNVHEIATILIDSPYCLSLWPTFGVKMSVTGPFCARHCPLDTVLLRIDSSNSVGVYMTFYIMDLYQIYKHHVPRIMLLLLLYDIWMVEIINQMWCNDGNLSKIIWPELKHSTTYYLIQLIDRPGPTFYVIMISNQHISFDVSILSILTLGLQRAY